MLERKNPGGREHSNSHLCPRDLHKDRLGVRNTPSHIPRTNNGGPVPLLFNHNIVWLFVGPVVKEREILSMNGECRNVARSDFGPTRAYNTGRRGNQPEPAQIQEHNTAMHTYTYIQQYI